jgi:hypothetical protein
MIFTEAEKIALTNFKKWADNKSVINAKVGNNWVKAQAENLNGSCFNARVLPEYHHFVCSDLLVIFPWEDSKDYYE